MSKKTRESSQEAVSDNTRLISALESILFSTAQPMTVKAFQNFFSEASREGEENFEFSASDIKKALKALKEDYESTRRGVVLEEVSHGFQIRTKLENKVFLQKSIKGRPFRLSGPALEALALVAYHQPCVKAKVDEVRGRGFESSVKRSYGKKSCGFCWKK